MVTWFWPRAARSNRLMALASLLAGTAIGVGAIVLLAGDIVPHGAVAKAAGAQGIVHAIQRFGEAHAGAFSFGTGLLAVWLMTAVATLGRSVQAGGTGAWIAINAAALVPLAALALRGQEIQGVRHAIAFTVFAAWCGLELRRHLGPADGPGVSLLRRRAVAALAGVMLAVWSLEGVVVARILRDRSDTFTAMSAAQLGRLSGSTGLAFDIGFIGWFTDAGICDANGLVHGAAFARLSSGDRLAWCVRQEPAFAFVNDAQAQQVDGLMDIDGWVPCGVFGFSNVATRNEHYLLVEPRLAASVCRR